MKHKKKLLISGCCFGAIAIFSLTIANSAPTVDSVVLSSDGIDPLTGIDASIDGDAVWQTFYPAEGGQLLYVYGDVTDANGCGEVNNASDFAIEVFHNGSSHVVPTISADTVNNAYEIATANIVLSGCGALPDLTTHYAASVLIHDTADDTTGTSDIWTAKVVVTDTSSTPAASADAFAEFEVGSMRSSEVGSGNVPGSGIGFVTNTHSAATGETTVVDETKVEDVLGTTTGGETGGGTGGSVGGSVAGEVEATGVEPTVEPAVVDETKAEDVVGTTGGSVAGSAVGEVEATEPTVEPTVVDETKAGEVGSTGGEAGGGTGGSAAGEVVSDVAGTTTGGLADVRLVAKVVLVQLKAPIMLQIFTPVQLEMTAPILVQMVAPQVLQVLAPLKLRVTASALIHMTGPALLQILTPVQLQLTAPALIQMIIPALIRLNTLVLHLLPI